MILTVIHGRPVRAAHAARRRDVLAIPVDEIIDHIGLGRGRRAGVVVGVVAGVYRGGIARTINAGAHGRLDVEPWRVSWLAPARAINPSLLMDWLGSDDAARRQPFTDIEAVRDWLALFTA